MTHFIGAIFACISSRMIFMSKSPQARRYLPSHRGITALWPVSNYAARLFGVRSTRV